mgnify:FL=1
MSITLGENIIEKRPALLNGYRLNDNEKADPFH